MITPFRLTTTAYFVSSLLLLYLEVAATILYIQ